MAREQVEREDKYDVPAGFVLPPLGMAIPGISESAETFILEATYFDTAARHLLRRRITLRRRQGGHDEGWHLKLPAGAARTELHVDLTGSVELVVPAELVELLLGIRGGQPLAPVVRLTTTRTAHTLREPAGTVLAEVVDDHVTSTVLDPPGHDSAWRELEVEAGPAGDETVLSAIGMSLVGAGAAVSASTSKAGRALGAPSPLPERADLGGLITRYLRTQVDAIAQADLALRRGEVAVHPMRVAVRRIRSTLRTYADVFEPAARHRIDHDLSWLADILGNVRDGDVQLARLRLLVGDAEHSAVVEELLARTHAQRGFDHARLIECLREPRYEHIIEALDAWAVEPPFTEKAQCPPTAAARPLDRAGRRLSAALDKAARPDAPDDDLHTARKCAKRLRYAAELATPALGPDAERLAERAQTLQDALGDYQDSVVAAGLIDAARHDLTSAHPLATDLAAFAAHESALAEGTRRNALLVAADHARFGPNG